MFTTMYSPILTVRQNFKILFVKENLHSDKTNRVFPKSSVDFSSRVYYKGFSKSLPGLPMYSTPS